MIQARLSTDQRELVERLCAIEDISVDDADVWESTTIPTGGVEGWIGNAYVMISKDAVLISLNRVRQPPG